MDRIYLDYAATTYLDSRVLKAMMPYLEEKFGNASGSYASGRESRKAIEDARHTVAKCINAAAKNEIIFTSGGTESDNWVLFGIADAYKDKGKHIVISSVEHHAMLDTCKFLEKQGFEITYLPVDSYGRVSPLDVAKAVRNDTILVSVMFINNEVGSINPVKEIAEVVHAKGCLFHTDAVQAVGHHPINVQKLGIDMLSASAHKFYGPKGIGFLYIKNGIKISRYMHGGAQEKKMRAGTENVAGIVGLGEALKISCNDMASEQKRLTVLRDYMIDSIFSEISSVKLNGHRTQRSVSNINFSFKDVMSEAALLDLDQNGVECSGGSACSVGSLEPSYVLKSMGLSDIEAKSALRFTLGRKTTKEDIDKAVKIIKRCVDRLRDFENNI